MSNTQAQSVKITKKQATDFLNTLIDTFERQSSANPVIYLYAGKVAISRGDTLGGMASVVYNRQADILLHAAALRHIYNLYKSGEFLKREAAALLKDAINGELETI